MKLRIIERILLSSLYPKKGNFIQMTLVEDIAKKAKLGQEEIKEIELRILPTEKGTSYNWNRDKAKDLDVNFTEAEITLLKNQVKELDKKGEITQELLSICRKIQEA